MVRELAAVDAHDAVLGQRDHQVDDESSHPVRVVVRDVQLDPAGAK